MNASRIAKHVPGKVYLVAIPLLALLFGASVAAVANESAPTKVLGSPAPKGESVLIELDPWEGPAVSSKESQGFTVEFQRAEAARDVGVVVYYRIKADGPGAFADMLGIPRIVNPDGSLVLPREYGVAGRVDGFQGGIRGLPSDSSAALFDQAAVQPGAVVRFGPFFRSLDAPFSMSTSGQELLQGYEDVINGDRFVISARANEDGTTTIEFVNTEAMATVVATHPGSAVSVEVDDIPAEIIHGSTNFAKTLGYDVNANRSSVDISGMISPGNKVTIVSSSIGKVHRGEWDFSLD